MRNCRLDYCEIVGYATVPIQQPSVTFTVVISPIYVNHIVTLDKDLDAVKILPAGRSGLKSPLLNLPVVEGFLWVNIGHFHVGHVITVALVAKTERACQFLLAGAHAIVTCGDEHVIYDDAEF